jgi:superfamily II DNA or RNA helicase
MKEGCRSILYQGATGSGKTALTAHMLHTAAGRGMRSWFVVHRKELIDQSARAFKLEGLKHGIIAAGYPEDRLSGVQIAGVQTLARRLARYPTPSLIVWDEAHHVAAKSWDSIFRRFAGVYHVGLTATPERLDGQGLGTFFKKLICGPTVAELTAQGYLSPYKLYAPANVDLSGVHRQMGDYARGELGAVMDKPKITGDAVQHYKKYCNGKRAIVFCVSIEHSKHVVEQFQKEGINAAHVDGETADDERSRAVDRFREGSVRVLSNVELFGEGFDLVGIEAAILLRPTQSLGLYLQQIGRALRPAEGKSLALILDHVGNCERFGLPDQPREWSLEGRDKSKGEYQAPVRICKECYAAFIPAPICPFCGAIFPLKPRTVETIAGNLKEVDAAQLQVRLKWRRQQGMTQTFADLVALGKARGYRNAYAWASLVLKGRAAKRLRVS